VTRVLIVSDQSMFSQGLEGLLRERQEIDLIDRWTYVDALPDCLEQCRPDVLFFGCSDPENCPAPVFMRCLREGIVQKIVCINLDDNAVYVFRGERHTVERVQDLVEAIVCPAPETVSSPAGCVQCAANQRKEA
jgi:DNA-binding NarL/FixJ family response regulator